MNTTHIGWIGIGNMGNPMSKQLIKAGYPITVYNRNKSKENSILEMGASSSSSPKQLLEQSDVIILMVSDDAAIREIFTGHQGLLESGATGKILINMSTVSPAISREMASLCLEKQFTYLDAPVSGSVKQAEEGSLVIMVGGYETALQQVKPILECLGKLVMRVGGTGAGNAAKLAINSLLAIQAQGLAETVVFARQNGIQTENLLELINQSALSNVFMKIKGSAIIHSNYQAAFALKHIAKDLRLAKEIGLKSPLGETTYATFQEAEFTLGDEDIISIIKNIHPY